MMAFVNSFICFALAASFVSASPITSLEGEAQLVERQDSGDNVTLLPYSTPPSPQGRASSARAAEIAVKRGTFTYGPAIVAGPYSPGGALGTTYEAGDSAITDSELALQEVITTTDYTKAMLDSGKYDGLQTLDDYTKLYDGEWQPSSQPTSQDPGMLTNYTQDLLFSMERLSFSPYIVRRLNPSQDTVPFTMDDATVTNITGSTLEDLFSSGALFYADHRNQSRLARSSRFTAFCDAYFYINSTSGDFLPLAIRTNTGNDLIYTPLDTPDDWLLAKIMYNVNDIFFAQFDHFTRHHFPTEIIYEAAVRTMSDSHPVLAILQRLMYGAFAIRPIALLVLTRSGGIVDEYFPYTGAAAAQYSNDSYNNGFAGAFQYNYFNTNLERRGLINQATGPDLKSFPYYEDALPLMDAISKFLTTFVSSYYASDNAVAQDSEIQAWVKEANGPAGIIDFPSAIKSKSTLTTVLTEMGRLVSVSHHAINTNQLVTGSATLPFHPTSLYKQVPLTKGETNLTQYLPGLSDALGITQVAANFARPLIAGSNRTLVHMFDDPLMLARMNGATRAANKQFKATMMARSQVVKNRNFDANGLSQGMPFVWKALDPNVAPWSLTI